MNGHVFVGLVLIAWHFQVGRAFACASMIMSSKTSHQFLDPSPIVWAVDPFQSDAEILKSAAWCLRALVRFNPSKVQPVFVWSTPALEFPVGNELDFESNLEKEAQDSLVSVLSRVKIPGIQPIKVIVRTAYSVREEAKQLIAYANRIGAKMIVVCTHGRTGFKRAVLGSFVETLSLYSNIPMVTVHPGWKRTPQFKRILFSTDFSDESRDAFQEVLEFSKKQMSQVILFNQPENTVYPAFDWGYVDYRLYQEAAQAKRTECERMAREMVSQGKKRGVKVHLVFDTNRSTSVYEMILKQSKRLGCMVAMAAQSGPATAVLMGSTTRQVIRHSVQPVWVIHASIKALNQKNPENQPLFEANPADFERDLFPNSRSEPPTQKQLR